MSMVCFRDGHESLEKITCISTQNKEVHVELTSYAEILSWRLTRIKEVTSRRNSILSQSVRHYN
jgi:hypothetical protein